MVIPWRKERDGYTIYKIQLITTGCQVLSNEYSVDTVDTVDTVERMEKCVSLVHAEMDGHASVENE